VEKAIAQFDEAVRSHPTGTTKPRLYIEYQYSESHEFLSMFNKIERLCNLARPASDKTGRSFNAIWYSEYVRDN